MPVEVERPSRTLKILAFYTPCRELHRCAQNAKQFGSPKELTDYVACTQMHPLRRSAALIAIRPAQQQTIKASGFGFRYLNYW